MRVSLYCYSSRFKLIRSWLHALDVTSCTTFNPVYPVIASCSGQRKFVLPQDESDSDDEEEEQVIDNTLKVWRIPGQYQWYTYDVDTTMETETIETVSETTDIVMESTNMETTDLVMVTETVDMETETTQVMATDVTDQMTAEIDMKN